MKTTVVNIRTSKKFDVYMGRGGPFGNPYVIGPDGNRPEVIRKFLIYFHERLRLDPEWKVKVEALRGKILACFCRPIDGFSGQVLCHAQIVAAYIDGVQPENIE